MLDGLVSSHPVHSLIQESVTKKKTKFYGIDTRGCLGQRRWPHRCCCPLPAAGSLRGASGRRMTHQNFGTDSSFLVGGLIFSLFLIKIFL